MTHLKSSLSVIILALLAIIVSLLTSSCQKNTPTPQGEANAPKVSHYQWDSLLSKYVDNDGWVDYQGFINDSLELKEYLDLLSANPPAISWSEADKIAYWINAYNAFTVKIIADNYPLESIRDLHSLPLVATVWHEEFFKIGGQPTSLNQIEHSILRKEFNEPRIHFAINCASVSCPVLRNEAYTPEKLDHQLDEQARRFLSEKIRNEITREEVRLSRLFLWFRGDFNKNGPLIDFLNQYAPVEIDKNADISYLNYDWSLNEKKEQD